MIVQHEDGTIGRYVLFQQNQIFVEPSGEVYPPQPIGLAAETYEAGTGQIWMMIYKHNPERFKLHNFTSQYMHAPAVDFGNKDYWRYIDPVFVTQNGEKKLKENELYESVHSLEFIQQENVETGEKTLECP